MNNLCTEKTKHYHRLVVTEDTNNQLLEARKQGKYNGKPCRFIKHLVMLGLREYQTRIGLEETKRQHSGAKIIPFPGVSLNQGDDFQNTLDDFLKKIGYIE
jgi:hypothetical protein